MEELIPDAPLRGAIMVQFGADPPGRLKGNHCRGPQAAQKAVPPDSGLQTELLPWEPRPGWHHFKVMRPLICLCLATGLLAGETPQPGRDPVFLSRVLADAEGGARPWKTFRVPEDSGSAVVEVVGEYSPEELRQVAFQEFLVWFKEDLQQFWRRHGFPDPGANWPSSTLPVNRSGGNPGPQNVPLGKIGF